jgi:hypothetical protein
MIQTNPECAQQERIDQLADQAALVFALDAERVPQSVRGGHQQTKHFGSCEVARRAGDGYARVPRPAAVTTGSWRNRGGAGRRTLQGRSHALHQRFSQQRLFDDGDAALRRPPAERRVGMGRDQNGRQVDPPGAEQGQQIEAAHAGQVLIQHQAAFRRQVLLRGQRLAACVCVHREAVEFE